MKRLALVLVLAAAALPASAPASGCRPMDCAPSGSMLGNTLFAIRPAGATGPVVVADVRTGKTRWQLPAGMLNGRLLVAQDQTTLAWYDAFTGRRVATATVDGPSTYLAGSSQDGRRAVLTYTSRKATRFAIVSPHAQRTIVLRGQNWGFDALADGNLYLLRYLRNGYQVRRFDLAANRLVARPLKDPRGSALIWGTPWARVTSNDGRYVFTLYVGQNGGAMVHQLDVRRSIARCIDLPGTGDFNSGTSYAMQLSPNGRTLWAVSPGYGRVVSIDVTSGHATGAFTFMPVSAASPGATVAAVSPRGDRLAVALGSDLFLITPATRKVVHRLRTARALAFSPSGSLWLVRGKALRRLRL
jgi:hypothetical protein